MIARNLEGESLPVLSPQTAGAALEVNIDGTLAHASSGNLSGGVYRLAVVSSVDDAGMRVKINELGVTDSATITTGMFMPNASVEYFAIPEGSHISVINGYLNVIKCI